MPSERRVLIWMCALTGVNQLGFGAVVPTLPLYAVAFGVSATAIGMAIALYGLARFAVAAPSGQIADRLGRRPALALGGVLTALGNLWCALASSYPEFMLARFVAGAGAGLIVTTGQIVLADISVPERRGRVMAIHQGTFIFAVGIGPFPGGLIASHFGLAAPFLACALAGVAAGLLAWFAVGETREMARLGPQGGKGRPGMIAQMRLLSGNLGFMLVCLNALMNALSRTGGLFALMPIIGNQRLGLSIAEIGAAMAIGSLLGVFAAYPTGMIVDYFGRKWVIVLATLLSGAAMLLFCIAPNYAWFMAGSIVWGIASSVSGAAPAAYAADSAPPGMNATTMSMYRMLGDIGYVAGPIILGLLADAWSAEASMALAALLLVAIGAAFALFAPETYSARAVRRGS